MKSGWLACIACPVIALLLLACWLYGQWTLDPLTEVVEVEGQSISVQWETVEWIPGHSGVHTNFGQFVSKDGWDGHGAIEMAQPLVSVAYADHYGNVTFKAHASVKGHRHEDWSSYVFFPEIFGGGITDGATHFRFDFDEDAKALRVQITQYLNTSRIAKTTHLRFVHDGKRFAWRLDG